MNNVIIVLLVAVAIGLGIFVFASDDEANDKQQVSLTFTTTEVAAHSAEGDCWTVINDKVYDLSEYSPVHPGGDEILRACGTNGTSLFTQRTTSTGETVGSGDPHSSRAESQLDGFLIGELAN